MVPINAIAGVQINRLNAQGVPLQADTGVLHIQRVANPGTGNETVFIQIMGDPASPNISSVSHMMVNGTISTVATQTDRNAPIAFSRQRPSSIVPGSFSVNSTSPTGTISRPGAGVNKADQG